MNNPHKSFQHSLKPPANLRAEKSHKPTMSAANNQLKLRSLMLIALILLSSCSTRKRTMIASAVSTAIIAGAGGAIFTPNEESKNANTYVFGLLGAAAGAAAGYYLYSDNKQITGEYLNDFKNQSYEDHRNTYEFKQTNSYKGKGTDIPEHLKSIIPRRRVIEYETSQKLIKKKDGKAIIIAPTKAWEVVQ